jgi:phosphate transport system protein
MDHRTKFNRDLAVLKDEVVKMGLMVQVLIGKSVDALLKFDRNTAEAVIKDDDEIDRLELSIDEKCIRLIALQQPEASDLRFLTTAMRIVNDLERIGDLAEDVAECVLDLIDQPLLKPLIDIPKMAAQAIEAVKLILDGFIEGDAKKAMGVWVIEKETDRLRDRIHDELVEIMSKNADTVNRAIPLLLISRHLERIVDHATNIAEDVVYMVEAKVVKHGGKEE